jgi:amidase
MMDLASLGAQSLAAGYRRGEFGPTDVVESCLAKIDALDPVYKAFLTVSGRARDEAVQAERRLKRGEARWLTGIPVALKDLTLTAGLRTTFGSRLFADHVPDQSDVVVERLRAEGAVIIGKTNTPSFGYGAITTNELLGPTLNPYDLRRTCGGSSGGSAVAVAANMVPLAMGTDFGGSVRLPASFCGIVGFRPAIGSIPAFPKTHMWQALMAPGSFGRTVEDAAMLAWTIAGADPRDPVSMRACPWPEPHFDRHERRRFHVAASPTLGFAPVDDEVQAVFGRAVERIRADHDVTDRPPDVPEGFQAAYEVIRGALLHDEFAPLIERHADQLSPTLKWNASRGNDISAASLMRAERVRMEAYLSLLAFLTEYDILATVGAPIAAFPVDQPEVLEINGKPLRNIIDYSAVELLGTMTGFPCLSIPCGTTSRGLPVGMQLIAAPHRQNDLLDFAVILQHECGFEYQPPPAIAAAERLHRKNDTVR